MSVAGHSSPSSPPIAGGLVGRGLDYLGRDLIARFATPVSILAILWATLALAMRGASWTPPIRSIFSRQLLFTFVDAIMVAIRLGAVVGVLIIVQAAVWIDAFGIPTDAIAPMLWRGIVRELAPLLACLVVIGRSGIAIATELATMRITGEIEVLDSQGIDPMTSLVMPRILSMTISVFCLALVLASTMVITGYVVGWSMGAIRLPWTTFLDSILRQFNSVDVAFFVPKTIIAGGFAGAICCLDGLTVRGTLTDVPRVASKSGTRALTAVFAVSAVLSVLIYGRFLVFKIV